MATARAFKATFGDDMAPGDAYITNHPYMSGVAHSVDMAVVTPFFSDGKLIAFSGGIAHKSDLGGVIPGTGYGQARELFQEGIMYPPVRLVRGGEWVRDVETILRANSRTPDLIMGDIRGQIGVARLGERRLADTIDKYGLQTVLDAFADIHDIAADQLRGPRSRRWPDGAFESEAFVDTDGIDLDRRIRYHVRVEKKGDRAALRLQRLRRSSDRTDQHPSRARRRHGLLRAHRVRRSDAADQRRDRGASSTRRSAKARCSTRAIPRRTTRTWRRRSRCARSRCRR